MKASQEQIQVQKWHSMAQTLSLHLILREAMSQIQAQNQLLTGQVTMFSEKKSLRELGHGLKAQLDLNTRQVQLLLSELETAKAQGQAFKEQAKALDQQLQRALQTARSGKDSVVSLQPSTRHLMLQEQEQYIVELETQLQETRKHLLDKKLALTDKDEELNAVKRQLQALDSNFQKLEEEKRELDNLVIKVSQELKSKEYDMRDFNYQIATEKDTLARQVELLKKELQEEKERKQRLEILESDLIHKADVKESEVQKLQVYLQEVEDKLAMKSEAIEKAQKVIERLNDEFDRVTSALSKTEAERDQARAELRETSRRVVDLNKQLQLMQTQHQTNQQHVSQALKNEIDELKEALRQYQQQFDEEKRNLAMSLREANEDKYKLHIERERSDQHFRKTVQALQDELEEAKVKHQQQVQTLELEFKEQKEGLLQVMSNKEEQAQSQLKYLHRRLKEVTQESHQLQTRGGSTGKVCYLQTLKQEFEAVTSEVLETRALIKTQSHCETLSMSKFEEFRAKVLTALDHWEVKAEGLASLSERYEKELCEQKSLFLSMRQLLKEKDLFIANIQRQIRQREQTRELYESTLKKELERQTYLIKAELLSQFTSTQKTAHIVNSENQELDRRFHSFKQEYLQLLDMKDQLTTQTQRLQVQIDMAQREVERLSQDQQEFLQRLRQILKPVAGTGDLLQEIESLVDEIRVRRDEVQGYKAQVSTLQEQATQDKQFLQSKVQAVEEQLMLIQRQNLNKEEEQQVQFLQKETKYINEIEKLKAEATSITQQLGTRERQLHKIQNQLSEKDDSINQLTDQVQTLHATVDTLKQENQQLQGKVEQLLLEVSQKDQDLKEALSAQEDLTTTLKRLEDRSKVLKDQLLDKDVELQRERELNLQLQDEKYQAVHVCDQAQEKTSILERENQSLYKDLVLCKEQLNSTLSRLEESERERYDLQRTCEQMTEVVAQVQSEVGESQRAVEHLNSALEKMKRKEHKAKDLKHQIRVMKANEQQMRDIIDGLRRQMHPPQNTLSIQTEPLQVQDLVNSHPDFSGYRQSLVALQNDLEMLQEALSQRNQDIDRLISEKRDLEELVDQHNQTLKQLRMNSHHITQSAHKENFNALNTQRESELYSRILQEKENYIMRLESEIGDMRRETEGLKEKLIGYEIGSLSMDNRSLGGARRSHQVSQYAAAPQNMSISKGKKPTNQTQGLNGSTLMFPYNQTQITSATNYNTLQGTQSQGDGEYNRSLNRSYL